MIQRVAAALLSLAIAAPAAAQGQLARQPVAESGVLAGAPYRIDVPADWNRDLVVFFHGYQPASERAADPYPPLGGTEVFLQRGYAVIQSGYSRQGWAVAEARADTRRLRAAFEQRFGRPARVFAAGYSMGGHLTLAAVEEEPDRYHGGLSLCGVNLPATGMMDRILGDVAAADALFPGIIPDPAAAGSPAMFDGEALARAMSADPAAAAQLSRWTGLRTADQAGTLWFYYVVLREMRERAGGFPGSNRGTRYRGFGDDRAFNARVRRYSAAPPALAYVHANASPAGALRDPVVILNNAYDDVVSTQTQASYPAAVRRRGRQALLTVLPPVGEGHCRFTGEQIGAAFDRLVAEAGRRRPRR